MSAAFLPRQKSNGDERPGLRTLVVGAGVAGRALARDLRDAPELGLWPIGFLDDDPAKTGAPGMPVLGTLADLAAVALSDRVEIVIIAIPLLATEKFRETARAAASVGASVRYLPRFIDAVERDVVGSDVRNFDVRRLIGRDEWHVVSPDAGAVIEGKRVLVTGAGGSIGSELCRQVYGFGPSSLFMLDHDESNLHRLQLELWGEAPLDSDDIIVADIRDRTRIDQLFAELRPDVVFHAAAHKHLPLLERHPCEGVKSNVRGTEIVLDAAVRHGAERFILISTDKAADPASILGATKRLAEMLVQHTAGGTTTAAAVRFGNVLGSRGSLLTVLAEQMRSRHPVTVTHCDATRFFMTIEEAVGLVLEAGRMAKGGEIFVLDMGDPVRIVDVVQSFAAQVHMHDYEIRFTGLRPGEKLNEALFSEQESCVPTEHPRVFKTLGEAPPATFRTSLGSLYAAARANDVATVRSLLTSMLPGYVPRLLEVPATAAPYADDF
ncbi:MAG TPA: polysaccharide biosynthesis protein [Actinomycetes bacterium]